MHEKLENPGPCHPIGSLLGLGTNNWSNKEELLAREPLGSLLILAVGSSPF